MPNNIKHIAFPEEHGSWGFVLEPQVLALLIAFSFSGLYLALASFFFFLAHQPIKIIVNPKKKKEIKRKAFVVVTLYLIVALSLLALCFASNSFNNFIPFLIAMGLMISYLFVEILGYSRKLFSELVASSAIDFIAVSILLLGGTDKTLAWSLLVLLLNRAIPTVLFVHERINYVHQRPVNKLAPIVAGVAGLILALVFAYYKWIPFPALLGVAVLFVRLLFGLSDRMMTQSLKKAGIMEFVYGVVFVMITAVSYLLW